MRNISELVRILAVAILLIPVSFVSARAEFLVGIMFDRSSGALAACYEELAATAPASGIPALTVRPLAGYEPGFPFMLSLQFGAGFESPVGFLDTPFVVRDAAHFREIVASDLYRSLIATEDTILSATLALAYGGTYHLFSRRVAFTEPQHFYGQWIGGPAFAVRAYTKHGAVLHPLVTFTLYHDSALHSMVEVMGKDSPAVSAVEAPLVDAVPLGLDQAARFVNLTASAVRPIRISIGTDEAWHALSGEYRKRFAEWAGIAAERCSRRNFETESALLDRFRAAGATIVPVNRQVFAEEAWKQTLSEALASEKWTLAEMDQAVRMGAPVSATTPAVVAKTLPSDVQHRLAEQQRAVTSAREAARGRGKTVDARDRILRIWSQGVQRLAADLRARARAESVPPPAWTRGWRGETLKKGDVAEVLEIVSRHRSTSDAEEGCRKRRNSDACARIANWMAFEARAHHVAGDRRRADEALKVLVGFVQEVSAWSDGGAETELARAVFLIRPADGLTAARRALDKVSEDSAAWSKSVYGALLRLRPLAMLFSAAGDRETTQALFETAFELEQTTEDGKILQLPFLAAWQFGVGNAAEGIMLMARAVELMSGPDELRTLAYAKNDFFLVEDNRMMLPSFWTGAARLVEQLDGHVSAMPNGKIEDPRLEWPTGWSGWDVQDNAWLAATMWKFAGNAAACEAQRSRLTNAQIKSYLKCEWPKN